MEREEREGNKQTDRQTDRQSIRQADKQTDREIHKVSKAVMEIIATQNATRRVQLAFVILLMTELKTSKQRKFSRSTTTFLKQVTFGHSYFVWKSYSQILI